QAWVQLCSLQCGLSSPYAQALPELHLCLIGLSIFDMPEPVSESKKWPSIKVSTHLPDEPLFRY
ncbi:MAG: hypothetical protein P9L94_09340, partial [Candidatus Hinthialibacter antarcticus]|nr:hypothetical protein [Candidatus Hinthialibacter antarcticus]